MFNFIPIYFGILFKRIHNFKTFIQSCFKGFFFLVAVGSGSNIKGIPGSRSPHSTMPVGKPRSSLRRTERDTTRPLTVKTAAIKNAFADLTNKKLEKQKEKEAERKDTEVLVLGQDESPPRPSASSRKRVKAVVSEESDEDSAEESAESEEEESGAEDESSDEDTHDDDEDDDDDEPLVKMKKPEDMSTAELLKLVKEQNAALEGT